MCRYAASVCVVCIPACRASENGAPPDGNCSLTLKSGLKLQKCSADRRKTEKVPRVIINSVLFAAWPSRLSFRPLLALPPALAWPGSPFSPALCRVLGRRSQLAIAQPAVRSPGLRLRQLTFPAMPGPQRSLSFAQLGPAARHQSSASAFHALFRR